MDYQIRRNRIPAYNNLKQNVIAERRMNTGNQVLSNPSGYKVAIESAVVDLSQAVLDPAPNYEIMIFCDLKETDTPPKPAGLEYGPNLFKFEGELTEIDQFMTWLDDVLIKAPQPFNLGHFDLDSNDCFTYSLSQDDRINAFDPGYFKVYFNLPLCRILDRFHSKIDEIYNDEIFRPLIPKAGLTTSRISTISRLNRIESLLFLTTLPITETQVLDANLNSSVNRPIIGSVELNAGQFDILAKGDWRYIPTFLRLYTMTQDYPIDNYVVSVFIQYYDTTIRHLTLGPSERFNVNIAFFPRDSVEE